jgi:hypothetical protein
MRLSRRGQPPGSWAAVGAFVDASGTAFAHTALPSALTTFGRPGMPRRDGASLAETGTRTTRSPARALRVDVSGVEPLTLRVTDGGDGVQNDGASWVTPESAGVERHA